MKYIKLAVLLITISVICSCQRAEREKIQELAKQYAESAGNKIRVSCKRIQGSDDETYPTIIKNQEFNEETKKLVLLIYITWKGGWTGNNIYVEGKIVCNKDGSDAIWELINSNCTLCDCPKYLPLGNL